MRKLQDPAMALSNPLMGGFHMNAAVLASIKVVVSMAEMVTVAEEAGMLSGGGGLVLDMFTLGDGVSIVLGYYTRFVLFNPRCWRT